MIEVVRFRESELNIHLPTNFKEHQNDQHTEPLQKI